MPFPKEGNLRPSTSGPSNSNERRLFSGGKYHTLSGKARIHFSPPTPMPEPCDEQFPFLLLTGRGTSSQWHTQSRTSKSPVLRKLYPEKPYFEIHPADAARLRISPNSQVRIVSRRGEVSASAYVAPTVAEGQIFLPMHYPEVNRLTHSAFDRHSRHKAAELQSLCGQLDLGLMSFEPRPLQNLENFNLKTN